MIARNKLLALFVIAVIALGAGLALNSMRQTAPDKSIGTKVLPALATELNEIDQISILAAGKKPFVTLKRTPDKTDWQVVECDNYRADFQKLREFLIKLSELEVVETKTSNAKLYAQIGVEDIESASATGKRIDFGGLKAPLGLIVGNSTPGGGNYVRVAGQAASALAKPQITLYSEPKVWLDHSLLDIPTSDVQEVRVQLADGKPAERSYSVARDSRQQNDFTAPKMPAGKKPAPGAANANADALSGLSFENVHAAKAGEDWSTGLSRAEFRLFDGTIVTALARTEKSAGGADAAEKHYVRFEVTFDEAQHQRFAAQSAPKEGAPAPAGQSAAPQIAAEQKNAPAADAASGREKAQKLQAKVSGWVYELPSYKYTAIFRPLDELAAKS